MRVTLLHNPTAGEGEASRRRLVELIEAQAHDVRYLSTKDKGWKQALRDPGDLVVAAGGDGTTMRVVRTVAGSDVPFALLPLGTANNIAKTLSVFGRADEIIRGWTAATPRPFDLGRVANTGDIFVEGMGGGLFGALIERGEEVEDAPLLVSRETDRALYLARELLDAATPQAWGIVADGRDLSTEVVAIEIMNTRFAGPNIPLAPHADAGDRRLDLVLIRDQDVAGMRDYLTGRLEQGGADPPPLEVVRVREVRLTPPPRVRLHLDDQLWSPPGDEPINIEVWPAACRTLAAGRR